MLSQRDWRRLVWWPGLAFGALLAALIGGELDREVAHALYYDGAAGWLGAGSGEWWARGLIHTSGRWVVRGLVAAALVGWLGSFVFESCARWRRELGYVVVAMILAVSIAGVLKRVTNVDCPWDLAEFGGDRPYVSLLGDRPDSLPRSACFPGSHSASGFALLAFYFALRDRARKWAHAAFAAGIAAGVTFAIGQEARGAHFLSHDVASAALTWLVLVKLYSWMLAPRPACSKIDAGHRVREHARDHAADDVPREAQPDGGGRRADDPRVVGREIERAPGTV
jgi:membrane-associated PAP2 superfamily phosphatase